MGKAGLILCALLAVPAAAEVPETALLTAAQPAKIAEVVRQLGRPGILTLQRGDEPPVYAVLTGLN